MGNINMTGGGGIHPGAPIIWPTSQKQSAQNQQVESQTASKADSASSTSAAQSASQTQSSQAAQAAAPAAPSARPMAMADVVDQLFQLGIPNSAENKELASTMMEHGVELSNDNFSQLFKLIKGDKQKSTMESAVVTLTKGLSSTPNAVDMLSGFLGNNPQISQQCQAIRAAMAMMQQRIATGQNLLDPGLMTSISSILLDMDEELKKLTKKADGDDLTPFNRGELLNNMKSLSQLLSGLEQKLAQNGKLNSPEGKDFQKQINDLKQQLKGPIENLTAQAILSKDADRSLTSLNDKFAYWQIPNPLAAKPSNIEIALRKDASKKNGDIDPRKTRMFIKLETPEMGEITIIIDVLDQKIWYIFNTENEDINRFITKMHADLLKRMESLNYKVSGFQAVKKKVDLKKYVLPTINLDNFIRIRAEV